MADLIKQIKEFPQKSDFGDNDLLLIQGQGTTYNVKGSAVKAYAENAAKPQADLAAQEAQAAAEAADRAEAAIQHPAIPDPATGNWKVWDQVSESYQETVPPVRAEGQDFEIKGYYPTLETLEAEVPDPEKGYAYGIGTEPPYDIYVWDMAHSVWVNNGPMTASGDMLKSTYDPQHKNQDIFAYAESVGIPAGGTTGQIPVKASDASRDVSWQDPPESVGHSMAGKTVYPIKDTPVTAAEGAEIFNDYRERTFGTSSNPDSDVVRTGNIATGKYSHAEGANTTASGSYAHAEGYRTMVSGSYAHAEGYITTASGSSSHAEGDSTTASGRNSHAEGYKTNVVSSNSHAEGDGTSILSESGWGNHAEGYGTSISGDYICGSHVEGIDTIATISGSHAGGISTIAAARGQTVIGSYNIESSSSINTFIIGKGSSSARANSFRVTSNGVYASGDYNASGADYAEFFEWSDGNPEHADRVGRFVTLEGKHIRLAGPGDGYILGIVSGAPSVVGDVYDDQWQGMYISDIFGRPIWEDVEVPDVVEELPDPENPQNIIPQVMIPAHTERRQKLNPDYDPDQPYIPRTERSEWDAVGMLGKLVAVDDGTCQVDGWATAGENGVATASAEQTRFRVMERLDESHVRILILR